MGELRSSWSSYATPTRMVRRPPPRGASPEPVLILRSGTIHTMDEPGTVVEAMVARGREIVYLGDDAGTKAHEGPGATIVALAGKAVLPGFHDTHAHLLMDATERSGVDLFGVETVDELLHVVEAWVGRNPRAPWVRGSGWSMASFDGRLHGAQLDAVVLDRPVFLSSADGHTALVNRRALELAGITRATPDPARGRIERDAAGEPTGVLQERATTLVSRLIPPHPRAAVDEDLAHALRMANGYGITTLVEASVEDWGLAAYARAAAAGALTLRVHGTVVVEPGEASPCELLAALRERYACDRVRVGAAKLFVDGIIESRTASMLAPYTDGSNGTPLFDDRELHALATELDAAGFQLHAHVIGDGATRQFLDAVEAVVAANGPRDRRPLLAHLELVDPEDFPRFAELGALAVFQFLWAHPDAYVQALTRPALGERRCEQLYPVGALHRAGATIVAGSDWSVSSMNPFEQIEVALTRQDPWQDAGPVLGPQHRIDLMTALRAFTSAGARASFSEALVGTLELGKRADFVVLDRDPFAIPSYELAKVRVLETWLDGERVFARADAPARAPRLRDLRDVEIDLRTNY